MNRDGEVVGFVELADGRPFSVITHTPDGRGYSTYDFEWCRRLGHIYYHMSGFGGRKGEPYLIGGDRQFWAAAGVEVVRQGKWRPRKKKYDRLPVLPGQRVAELPDPYRVATIFSDDWLCSESEVVYCTPCNDFMPDDDLCRHVKWCDSCSWWSQPGEPCPHMHPKQYRRKAEANS